MRSPMRARLALVAAALAIGCNRSDAPELRVSRSAGQASVPSAPAAPAARAKATTAVNVARRTALVSATERVSGAVVSISVRSRQEARPQSPWDFFFVPEGPRVLEGYGTGFIIRPNGIILTNQHVVANAERVVVTLPDGSDLPAKVLGQDPLTDIAVLRVDRNGLPAVTTGRSTDLMIGEWVVALGNPYAYMLGNAEPTVTVGVVSATGRNILPSGDQTGLYFDMIQTDAAINPGNSGGPLTNALGEVIGVNSSIFSNSGGSVGLGFAIPIERALRVADEIIKNGTVRRAWVGLEVQGASAMRDWKSAGGVTVASVAPGGPAAKAGLAKGDVLMTANGRRLRNYLKLAPEVARATGLQEGDVILAINRTPVRTAAQVQELLNVRPGEVIRVYLERDGQITFTDLVFR
jgi:serine protease Do